MKKGVVALLLFTGMLGLSLIRAPSTLAGGTVTNCANDTQFSTMLSGGGTINFNCGNATIVLTSAKTILANTTIDGGGKITLSADTKFRHFNVNSGVTLTLQNIILSSGYNAGDGGSIRNDGTLNVVNVTFYNNQTASASSGGAIVSYGTLNITNSEFKENKGGSGGAVYARWAAVTTIKHSWFHDNATTSSTTGLGGAILTWDGAQITIEDSRFNDNTAAFGGAIYNTANSTIDVTRSHFETNIAFPGNSTGGGGAIYNRGVFTLARSTLLNNGSFFGGALRNLNGTFTATNVTGVGNYSAGYGNFLANLEGNVVLTNVTIVSDGRGTSFGQIFQEGINNSTRVRLKNTIIDVSDHTPHAQASCYNLNPNSTIISDGNNLLTDGGCGNLQLSDKTNTPSLLSGPDNFGSGALTFLPQKNSQAINNGSAAGAPSIDQRGIARPQNGGVDIGAVERCAKPTKPTLLSPAVGAQTNKKPKLDWNDSPCFATYKLQVRAGSPSGANVLTLNNLALSQFKTNPLTKGETYFWRVTAKNEGGKAKSAWGTFTVK